MKKLILITAILSQTAITGLKAQTQAEAQPFSGPHTTWHENFDRYDYIMDTTTMTITPYAPPAKEGFGIQNPPPGTRRCIIIAPKKPAAGNPWSWRGCYWDHQPQTEIELLKRGFYIAYISANATLKPGKEWDAWYNWLTKEKDLSPKPAFIGMSRGGEYEYQWATTHPDKVSCIYADNPAVDRESLALLSGLAANDVPLLHICGSIDPLYTNSTAAVENIYHAFGSRISIIIKEGYGHHPPSLHDATPIADFIEKSVEEKGPKNQNVKENPAEPPPFIKAVYTGPGTTIAKTYYYSSIDTYRWSPAEKTTLTQRGPFFTGAFARYQLIIPGVDAFTTVIVPERPAAGNPWVFRADYVTPDDTITQTLLAKGWTIVTGAVPYNYDAPVLQQWNAIYTYLTNFGFDKKPVMMGRKSAAGEALAWAIENPDKVACIYGEDPILQSKLMHPNPGESLSILKNVPIKFNKKQSGKNSKSAAEALDFIQKAHPTKTL